MFNEIWDDFEEYIIYIPWQPLKDGKIYYEQIGAGLNYIYYFKQITKWTLYLDFDEYLYSPKELNVIDYVLQKQK